MKRISEMSDEEKRIAIAVACGWEFCEKAKTRRGQKLPWTIPHCRHATYTKNIWRPLGRLSRYDSDLNACAEMRKTLKSKPYQNAYTRYLETTVSGRPNANLWSWALLDASAEDHCRAFLLTLGHQP